jgi:hypothetical protein
LGGGGRSIARLAILTADDHATTARAQHHPTLQFPCCDAFSAAKHPPRGHLFDYQRLCFVAWSSTMMADLQTKVEPPSANSGFGRRRTGPSGPPLMRCSPIIMASRQQTSGKSLRNGRSRSRVQLRHGVLAKQASHCRSRMLISRHASVGRVTSRSRVASIDPPVSTSSPLTAPLVGVRWQLFSVPNYAASLLMQVNQFRLIKGQRKYLATLEGGNYGQENSIYRWRSN